MQCVIMAYPGQARYFINMPGKAIKKIVRHTLSRPIFVGLVIL